MKSFVIALTTLILLITGGIFYTNYLEAFSQTLTEASDAVLKSAEAGDFSKAQEQFETLKKHYHSREKILFMTMNHEQISSISVLLEAAEKYILCKDKNNTLAYIAMLRSHFFSLPQEEIFSFENIV